jgi:hypothetical protein
VPYLSEVASSGTGAKGFGVVELQHVHLVRCRLGTLGVVALTLPLGANRVLVALPTGVQRGQILGVPEAEGE